ncbi:hypothetical protein THORNTON_19 [Bacillus phage Thornton]|uniref:Uncharacterized protein n=1 Tax=Bacillus phage Thornton TaxID=2795746 RepID=A0A7T7GT62_9CAUD|nr:hypothetical protein KNV72_gp19 [Bacillus phage Thornton]QQM15010.1 hypothetical protein THORNTON_19 [Bacillus phage Thornton]
MILELLEEYEHQKNKMNESIKGGYLYSAKTYLECMITIKETLEKQYNYYIKS